MSDNIKAFFITIGLLLIGLLVISAIFVWASKVGKEDFEKEIQDYSTLVVNGEEYPISEIVEIEYVTHYHEEDEIKVILSNGTKVIFTEHSYTLKK